MCPVKRKGSSSTNFVTPKDPLLVSELNPRQSFYFQSHYWFRMKTSWRLNIFDFLDTKVTYCGMSKEASITINYCNYIVMKCFLLSNLMQKIWPRH